MLKYAIFDLDDTLLDFKKGEDEGLTNIFTKYGVGNLQKGFETYLEINREVWEAIERGESRKELLNTRFSKTFKKFGITVDGAVVEAEYRQSLDRNFHKLDGTDQLLEHLKSAGVRLLVGTNGVKKTQVSRLEGSGLNQYFDDYFISEDIGFSKPDKRFFDPMLAKYKDMNAQNAVMVGDRLQADILGAKRAGLSSIWYNPKQIQNEEQYQPTYEVDRFDQLEEIILKA